MSDSHIQLPPDSSGKKSRTIEETVGAHTVHTAFLTYRQQPSFTAHARDIVPGTNAYMLAILNRVTAKVVRVWRANMYVSIATSITGVLLRSELRRITATVALSGGTAVTPTPHDTLESLPANIDVMAKPTNTIADAGLFKTFLLSGDEPTVSTFDADAMAAMDYPRDRSALFTIDFPLVKPVVLRTNGTTHEGLAIKNLVGAVGNIGLELLFTVDDQ